MRQIDRERQRQGQRDRDRQRQREIEKQRDRDRDAWIPSVFQAVYQQLIKLCRIVDVTL